MASLASHFSGFLFLFPIGIRRLLCSSSLYLNNPSLFRSKPWYFSNPIWKNLDLYILSVALPIASFSQFFIFLSFSGHPTYRFSFFHQSASMAIFWALIVLFLLREKIDPFLVNESFVFAFAGIVFLVEYIVTGEGITGVGGVVYQLLGQLTLVCAGSCLLLSVRPNSFFAEFLLSCGLVFKGTWFLQAGFSLYTNKFGLKGCQKLLVPPGSPNADVHCELEDDGSRAVALVNLLFVVHAIGVLIAGFVLFGLMSSFKNLRCGEKSGPLLAELESENVMHAGHEVERE
ncbi:hypothetical protein SLA2020_161330 [Shorea laevis]